MQFKRDREKREYKIIAKITGYSVSWEILLNGKRYKFHFNGKATCNQQLYFLEYCMVRIVIS